MTREQRQEALQNAVNLHQPTAALSIFLAVVALEDFVRDLGARCADEPTIQTHFPKIGQLRMKPVARRSDRPFARLDKDPAPLTDFIELNSVYRDVLDCQPFDQCLLERLYDLALIRHTVAHHGARVRPIDAPRFQHWAVRPNMAINPPRTFVHSVVRFIHQVGSAFRVGVQNGVFRQVIPTLPTGWVESPPAELCSLLELFNYFGKLVSESDLPSGWHESDPVKRVRLQEQNHRNRLIQLCVADLSGGLPLPAPIPDAV